MRALIIVGLLLASASVSGIVVAQNAGGRTPPLAGDADGRPPRWRPEQAGRFSAVVAGDKAILLDTVTGESWSLISGEGESGVRWAPIAGGPHADRRPRPGDRSPSAVPTSDDDGPDALEKREEPPAGRPRNGR
jgi:hypothetical protein